MDETNTTEFVSNNKFDDLEPQFKPLFTPISKRTVVDYCSDVNGNIRMHIDYSLPPRYENTMPSQVPPDLDNE